MRSTWRQLAVAAIMVFLVRHAEKAASEGDPGLSEAGVKRAAALATTLGDAGITAIFSTEYNRTKDTAAPLARRLDVPVTIVPAKDMDGLVAKLRALAPGTRALVVGHSNTVPAMAQKLTGVKVADLTDADYDRLFVALPEKDGHGEVLSLHY
jgi:broad specificity phosphatase PhoE